MNYYGKLIVCDRCGKKRFLKLLDRVSFIDGTIESSSSYEDPEGWELIPSESVIKGLRGMANVCPECFDEFRKSLGLYYSKCHKDKESEIMMS